MFTWTHPDDESVTITLPEASAVPAGVWRRIRRMDEMDAMFTLLESVTDADGLAVLDTLTIEQLGTVFKEWHGGVGLGESSGSST